MTMQDDPNYGRRPVDPLLNRDSQGRRVDGNTGMGWGIPAALVAAAIIVGIFFMLPSDRRTTTASNNAPQVTTSTPAPAPTTPTPNPPAKAQ